MPRFAKRYIYRTITFTMPRREVEPAQIKGLEIGGRDFLLLSATAGSDKQARPVSCRARRDAREHQMAFECAGLTL